MKDAFRHWAHIPEQMLEVELPREKRRELDEILSKLRTSRDRAATPKTLSHEEFLVFNRFGNKAPICWCFNSWAEPYLLAHQLSDDQPLIAAHSFHNHERSWKNKGLYNEALAKRYLECFLQLFDARECIFGGNCQGAPIAESMCIQASQEYGFQPRLVTVDYTPKRRYQGPIMMFFGDESPFNPFRYERDPIPYWRERLNTFHWIELRAKHGTYFKEPTITTLANGILGLI